MDRRIAFTFEVPYVEDFLYTSRYQMIALGQLCRALVTTDIGLRGLPCVPNSPADLTVIVEPGEVYKEEDVDDTAYGSIPADTTRQIIKQGIIWDDTQLTCPAPTTPGNSVKQLVQITYEEEDTDALSRQFFDGTTVTNQTVEQVRLGKCVVELETGTEAPTGTEVIPTPDSGYAGAWVVTIAHGQTTITAGDIAEYPNAPFIEHTIIDSASKKEVQRSAFNYAAATGPADAYVVALTPAITAYTDGLTIDAKINITNTGDSTLDAGAGAKQIVDLRGAIMTANDLRLNEIETFKFNTTLDKWVLQSFLAVDIPPLMPTSFSGVHCKQIGGDPAHDIEFGIGGGRGEKNLANCILTAPIIKQIDANWAEGNNAGGFPSGITIANGQWYHRFIISKLNGETDAGWDSSPTAVNLLADAVSAGYVDYHRVGSTKLNVGATTIRDFIETVTLGGARITYWETVDLTNKPVFPGATVTSLAALDVPPDVKTTAVFTAGCDTNTGDTSIYFSDPDQASQTPNHTTGFSDNVIENPPTFFGTRHKIRTNTASQVRFTKEGAWGGASNLSFYTIGWEE
jgi:hypothetical protein